MEKVYLNPNVKAIKNPKTNDVFLIWIPSSATEPELGEKNNSIEIAKVLDALVEVCQEKMKEWDDG